jgi:hypothetical protein
MERHRRAEPVSLLRSIFLGIVEGPVLYCHLLWNEPQLGTRPLNAAVLPVSAPRKHVGRSRSSEETPERSCSIIRNQKQSDGNVGEYTVRTDHTYVILDDLTAYISFWVIYSLFWIGSQRVRRQTDRRFRHSERPGTAARRDAMLTYDGNLWHVMKRPG